MYAKENCCIFTAVFFYLLMPDMSILFDQRNFLRVNPTSSPSNLIEGEKYTLPNSESSSKKPASAYLSLSSLSAKLADISS